MDVGVHCVCLALWASFVVETPAGAIYAIGDTGFGDGSTFREMIDIDAPGPAAYDFSAFPFKKAPKTLYPLNR